jgi:hypothetical protein
MQRARPSEPPRPPRDTGSYGWRSVLLGTGAFDIRGPAQNKRGWELFELGQESFWDVPTAVDWDAPWPEDPEDAEAIAAMLGFLCPGEKAAVTGATLLSLQLRSEEARFYFAQQALEEAKHFDALRRAIPRLTGRPVDVPRLSVRLLYSFGVVDPDDLAFMMGNINVVGEHLANQIFVKIKPAAQSEPLQHLLELISRDEARHIAAGRRFWPEVWPDWKRNRRRIMARNLAVSVLLSVAGRDLVGPMTRLGIDLELIASRMFDHYEDVMGGVPALPEQAVVDALIGLVRKYARGSVHVLAAFTDANGQFDARRFTEVCERALTSPRALRSLFA